MSWLLVGSMALKTATAFIGGNKADAAAYKQQAQQLLQEQNTWEANAGDNKAIGDANLTNQIRSGYKVGLLNVQKAQAKKRAMQDGFDVSVSAQQALGQANANAAAVGSIGSSVDAVINDIDSKVDEAGIKMGQDFETQSDNFDVQLVDLLNQGTDSLRSSVKANVAHAADVSTHSFTDALVGAGIDTAQTYLSQKMSIGKK